MNNDIVCTLSEVDQVRQILGREYTLQEHSTSIGARECFKTILGTGGARDSTQ